MKGKVKKPKGRNANADATNANYQAEKHLRDFCNATSHELANAIATIVGELDFAQSQAPAGTETTALRVSLAAAEKALSLARNLRYFAVHTRLDVQPVDLAQLCLDTIDIVEDSMLRQKVHLEVSVEANTYAYVDPGAIAQVLLNLLTNAGKAMAATGGQLTITLRRLKGSIELICRDTGKGIPAEALETLFAPTLESESAVSVPHFRENHGLGLAVSKALIDAHGGTIDVKSKLGQGTTFTLILPEHAPQVRISPFLEKRRFRRVQVCLPAELHTSEGTFRCEVTTLSVGGCFIRCLDDSTRLPEIRSAVSLSLHYYEGQQVQIGKAHVANQIEQGGLRGVGIEFAELDGKAKRILAAIVKSHTS